MSRWQCCRVFGLARCPNIGTLHQTAAVAPPVMLGASPLHDTELGLARSLATARSRANIHSNQKGKRGSLYYLAIHITSISKKFSFDIDFFCWKMVVRIFIWCYRLCTIVVTFLLSYTLFIAYSKLKHVKQLHSYLDYCLDTQDSTWQHNNAHNYTFTKQTGWTYDGNKYNKHVTCKSYVSFGTLVRISCTIT